MIYTHVLNRPGLSVKSPADNEFLPRRVLVHASFVAFKCRCRGKDGDEVRGASVRVGLVIVGVKIVPVGEAMRILSGCAPFSDYPAQDRFFPFSLVRHTGLL
jgi:hypothetical protein